MSTPAAQMPGVGRGGHTVTPFTCSSLVSLATGAPLWLSWTEAGEKRECDCVRHNRFVRRRRCSAWERSLDTTVCIQTQADVCR